MEILVNLLCRCDYAKQSFESELPPPYSHMYHVIRGSLINEAKKNYNKTLRDKEKVKIVAALGTKVTYMETIHALATQGGRCFVLTCLIPRERRYMSKW